MEATAHYIDDTLHVRVSGTWSLNTRVPRFDDTVRTALSAPASTEAFADAFGDVDVVAFKTDDLRDWDSSLLAFLHSAVRTCEAHDVDLDVDGLPADVVRLVEMSRAAPEASPEDEKSSTSRLAKLGHWVLDGVDGMVDFAAFLGRVIRSTGRLVSGRGRMRAHDFWAIVQRTTTRALPIVSLISFLVGLILSFLGAVVLQRFGADYFVSYLVSYGILRELGALMTAIIMAGRTGAAFAAELGSMKISEEIDALETLGLSAVDFLVMPRLLAVFVALPLLTLYANAVGIAGGWAVAVSMLDVSTPQFLTGLLEPTTLADAVLGVVKAVVFGVIVGVTGCLRGLQTGDDASAVGNAATSAVVTGITLIVAANAIIDWLAAVLDV